MSEALARGFSRYQFYQLRDEGLIEPVSRGLYRLVDLPPTENPVLDYPPVAGYRFSGLAFSAGIEQVDVDGITLNVYNPEKTLADCFKFRNRIGMDVVLEALELSRISKTFLPGKLMEYARICRVATVMAPYVESKL